MGKGCITVTKYFLFLFNLLFFVFGGLIMGFGLWVLLDDQSFIAVLQESSDTVKVAAYILIGVGSLSMALGFFGCIGAIYEIRCLLGLYFTCLLLILIGQVTAGVLIYFQRDQLKHEMSNIIKDMIVNYTGVNRTAEHTWDYVQKSMKCCGWTGPGNWSDNLRIKNSSQNLYPCSCRNESLPGSDIKLEGLCEHLSADLPVFETLSQALLFFPSLTQSKVNKLCFEKALLMSASDHGDIRLPPAHGPPTLSSLLQGCITNVEKWLLENCGVILGICAGVAVIELLGMILSMCLCKSVVQEDYSKVPKY
ncbi:CD82 antigen [Takifugu flavidus]|uniref:Tetraspanin n=1 Tax=Takifugu flavidus TaxID=433684 RepID=A0A5C6PB35_9TELE|nr:CD82 antigen [Takifugu flavidus]